MKSEEFFTKYDVFKHKIEENKYWIWSLRPQQVTYCSSLITLKRAANSLSALSKEEFSALHDIVVKLETSIDIFAAPKLYNYSTLMLVDRYIHFHVFPRYDADLRTELQIEMDPFFPNPVDLHSVCPNMSTDTSLINLKSQLFACVGKDYD